MFLGRYDFDGDPDTLLGAYDRMLAQIPNEAIGYHVCIQRDGGISVYDTCPSAEVFAAVSTGHVLLDLMRGSGLPAPTVTPLGSVHAARAAATRFG